MGTITRIAGRSRAVIALAVTLTATGGVLASTVAPAHAATRTPSCTGATTYAGKTMPGYQGKRVPCAIAYGARGYQVTVLQRYLNSDVREGVPLVVDGRFGPATKQAVAAFQRKWDGYPCGNSTVHGVRLAVDGMWGPNTSKVSQNRLEYCGD